MESEANNELICLFHKDDIRAFDRIFEVYSEKIYYFAFSFLKNKEDAEGIVQEVFIRLWNIRKKINESWSLKGFLFTISYNLIMDTFREKMKTRKFLTLLCHKAELKDDACEHGIDYNDLEKHYLNLIEQLPPRRKIIFKLSRLEGYSYNEISDRLHISVNTVENQISAALRFFRKQLSNSLFV